MTEKNENKAVEIALNRVENAKIHRARMSEGMKAVQVSHAENGNEVRPTGRKAIIKTLVNNKVDENNRVDPNLGEDVRVTDVKIRHFDDKSMKEFMDYSKALNSAHRELKSKAKVQGA